MLSGLGRVVDVNAITSIASVFAVVHVWHGPRLLVNQFKKF